jgi:seryl-tRNA synthetase
MSFNYHLDHFGEIWRIRTESGGVAHTGCVAFGMDRLAVAMFARHGLAVENWPARVQEALALD